MKELYASALASLQRTERELLEVLAKAAAEADYEMIEFARVAATRINQFLSELAPKSAQTNPSPFQKTPKQVRLSQKMQTQKRPRFQPKVASGFPRYQIRDGCLYKEGWSKKLRKIYTHRVPDESFTRVITAMQRAADGANNPVAADKILTDFELQGEKPLPAYQFYVVLGLLRENSIVRQVGREGHILPKDLQLQARVLWNRLLASPSQPKRESTD